MTSEKGLKKIRGYGEIMAVAALLVLTTMVFLPAMEYGFVTELDDFAHVVSNTHLDFTWANLIYWCTHSIVAVYMPVTMFSYMLDHLIWGVNPLGYHLQSLFWHLVTAVMVYRCFRICGVKIAWAWMAAAVWAVNPMRVESVVWVSERKDVMCAAFYFWSLYCYLKADGEEKFNWRAWILMVLALLCKPMAVSLPLLFMLIDFNRRQKIEFRYYLYRFIPYLVAVAVVVALTLHYQLGEVPRHRDWGRQALVVLHNFYWYSVQSFVPDGMRAIYPRALIGTEMLVKMAVFYGVLVLLGIWAWFKMERQRFWYELLPMVLAYLLALAPVIGVFHLGFIDYADRYEYIPAVFLLFLVWRCVSWIGGGVPKRLRQVAGMALAVYLTWLAWASLEYLPAWRSYYDLLQHSAGYNRVSEIVLVELGLNECERGNYPAVDSIAGRLQSGVDSDYRYDLSSGRFYAGLLRAKAAYDLKQYAVAERILLEIYPGLAPERYYKSGIPRFVLRHLISIRMHANDFLRAQVYMTQLLKMYDGQDKDYDYYYYRGLSAGIAGNLKQAEDDFNVALRLKPDDQAVISNLQQVYRQKAAVKP